MHQTKKGNQWYFGMKAHFGVDRRRKVIHSVVAIAANVHDSAVLGDLLHGKERDVWGDQAYQGQVRARVRAGAILDVDLYKEEKFWIHTLLTTKLPSGHQ